MDNEGTIIGLLQKILQTLQNIENDSILGTLQEIRTQPEEVNETLHRIDTHPT